jgi:hypothetical protein
VLGARPETNERDVGTFPGGDRADVLHIDFAGDHLVSEGNDDRGDQRKAILSLVSDQDAQLPIFHRLSSPRSFQGRRDVFCPIRLGGYHGLCRFA